MPQPDDERRFTTARSTLLVDRGMDLFIRAGGILVIIAVFGILLFILAQVLPLFGGATVGGGQASRPTGVGAPVALLVDEWGSLPITVDAQGRTLAHHLPPNDPSGSVTKPVPAKVDESRIDLGGARISAALSQVRSQRLVLGTDDGRVVVLGAEWVDAGVVGKGMNTAGRLVQQSADPFGVPGRPIAALGYGDSGGDRLLAVIQEVEGRRVVTAQHAAAKKLRGGKVKLTLGPAVDLSAKVAGRADRLLVDDRAESVLVGNDHGELFWFVRHEDDFELRQTLRPFGSLEGSARLVAGFDYVYGDVSLVAWNDQGLARKFSLYLKPGEQLRTFGQIMEWTGLPGTASAFAASQRNKSFLLAGDGWIQVRHATSGTLRWQGGAPGKAALASFNAKQSRLLIADQYGAVRSLEFHDEHPEAGFAALFGKVWYEGQAAPAFTWQSTGGDDSEPKFSMVPLIFGTLKATLYAMLFSVPIALLAAIYTSEFMHPRLKAVIKPVIEIMAALPSVVLGFLGALVLAPYLAPRIPSFLAAALIIPIAAIAAGWFWSGLPSRWRAMIRPGYETLAVLPLILLVGWVAWNLGPAVERVFFSVTMSDGSQVADFRLWWSNLVGGSAGFVQGNSLIVGLMMGFAVIPIIFTIAEDSLANVPQTLRSGSLALGASRWQTAIRVVLPTASPGIFSALMIGLGRAIGETMIILMAAGGTPIMDLNIFNGLRSLAANLANELPEATKDDTHYRVLFLGALLLFALTFVINTIAEVVRARLRDRYKTV